MKKLQDLREYLLTRIPQLATNPDQLLTFVEDGKIHFYPGDWYGNYTHEYLMPIQLVITDWRHPVDDIMLPVLEWLSVREPGFDPKSTISFDAEIIDKETTDLSIKLNVTERVIVKFANGVRTITNVLPEAPLQMNPDAQWAFTVEAPGESYDVPPDDE